MEQAIRALPGQYLWGYNRYKSPRRLRAGEGT
jgi:lauroyl/myristoyl acyltransferase